MKGAVIYSSKTGNTKKVAETIKNALNEDFEIYSVSENPDPEDFDFIFMGYWVDKGTANEEAMKFMKTLNNKKMAVFATLGDYAHTDHAKESLQKGIELLGENCEVVSTFICQGSIDPQLIAWMKKLPADHPHAPNPARIKRWEDASTRPNEEDLKNAAEFAKSVLAELV
ncbi:MAG: flavodoxin [Candidatus Cloacimonadota bacterium]|nr:MAG: flavodoxin [Candidatus Cloacimonadota bacterium]